MALNPPYQGDLGNFAKAGVIGECLLTSLIHYSLWNNGGHHQL